MKTKKILIILFSFLFIQKNFAQVNKPVENDLPGSTFPTYGLSSYPNVDLNANIFNYTRTLTPLYPTSAIPVMWHKTLVKTDYVNGWGETIQSIKSGNLLIDDIITPVDRRIRHSKYSFPSYINGRGNSFQKFAFSDQQAYYNSPSNADYNIENGYSFSVEEIQPNTQDNIVYKKDYSAGSSFAGSARGTTSFTVYNSSGSGNIWNFKVNANGNPEIVNAYAVSQITIKNTLGQHNAETYEYFNKSNQLIAKKQKNGSGWLYTYYVYDDYGKLAWLLTPKACAAISGSGWIPSQSMLDNLCYHYIYSAQGQIIESKIPDQEGVNRFVYDKKDRLVLSQTPLLNQQGKWAFSVYDNRDRVVFSGLVSSNRSYTDWQTVLSSTPPSGTIDYYIAKGTTYGILPPTSLSGCEINVVNYYDDYNNLPSPLSGRTINTSYASDFLSGQAILPHQVNLFKTDGLLVASKIRVLDPSNPNLWINNVFFYDDLGKVLQTHTLSHWNTNTWDLSLNQYDFSGNLVLNILDHTPWGGATKANTLVMTKYNFDERSGMLLDVKQNVDRAGWQAISSNSYDRSGTLKTKTIGEVEVQDYNYNIRNQITGINKKYVEDIGYNNRRTFGEAISYDYGFEQNRYDGAIAGYMWRGSGSLAIPRAYGYGYDNVARMTFADFNQRSHQFNGTPPIVPMPTWGTDLYSTWNITYDDNGNIQGMNQNDVVSSTQTWVDQLSYHYSINTNKLAYVTEHQPAHGTNDFFDGNPGIGDYSYDKDGNLTKDLNKGIGNIVYNHFDLPTSVIAGSNTITNIYDGQGNLVQKKTHVSGIDTTYRYWGPFVYRDNDLTYFKHAEGRTRWMKDSLKFKNDFFIKDHLGNVRTVLTADIGYGNYFYWAGFELAAAPAEEALFTQIAPIREAKPTGTPGDVMSGMLDGMDPAKRIGTALIFRARPGDQIDLHAWGYYEASDSADMNIYATSEDMFASLMNTFNSPGLVGGGEGGTANVSPAVINSILSPTNYNLYEDLKNSVTDLAYPRLYLNFLVFDQQMNLLPDQSSVTQFKGGANAWHLLDKNATYTVEGNNYVMAYLSMESGRKIYIDNTNIVVVSGRQLEEQHYYPHGRLIEANPSTIPSLVNKYLHQGKKLQTELNMDLYDFHARQYDPQLGRFWGVDPENEFPSGYTGMGNDPANFVDPTGTKISPAWDPEKGYTGAGIIDLIFQGIKQNQGTSSEFLPIQGIKKGKVGGGTAAAAAGTGGSGMAVGSSYGSSASGRGGRPYHWYETGAGKAIVGFSDWFNYNLNPLYWGFNGAQGLFTEKDFLSGEYMHPADATSQIIGAIPISWGGNLIIKDGSVLLKEMRRLSASKAGSAVARKMGSSLESVGDIMVNPALLEGRSYLEIRNLLGNTKGWQNDVMRKSSRAEGWVLREMNQAGTDFTGRLIQYHPGTPRHFDGAPYWKVSSGNGTFRVTAK